MHLLHTFWIIFSLFGSFYYWFFGARVSSFIILYACFWIYVFLWFGLVSFVQIWPANCVLWLLCPVKVSSRIVVPFWCYSVPYILTVGFNLNFRIYNFISFIGFFDLFTSVCRLFLLDLDCKSFLEHFDIFFVLLRTVIRVLS